MYSVQIMEEFYNPEHYDNMRGADGVGKVVCDNGDEIIKIFIKVEGNKIIDASFQTFGGVVAIALTSFANNYLIGKSISEASKIDADYIISKAGEIPENRMYLVHAVVNCAKLALSNIGKKSSKDDE